MRIQFGGFINPVPVLTELLGMLVLDLHFEHIVSDHAAGNQPRSGRVHTSGGSLPGHVRSGRWGEGLPDG